MSPVVATEGGKRVALVHAVGDPGLPGSLGSLLASDMPENRRALAAAETLQAVYDRPLSKTEIARLARIIGKIDHEHAEDAINYLSRLRTALGNDISENQWKQINKLIDSGVFLEGMEVILNPKSPVTSSLGISSLLKGLAHFCAVNGEAQLGVVESVLRLTTRVYRSEVDPGRTDSEAVDDLMKVAAKLGAHCQSVFGSIEQVTGEWDFPTCSHFYGCIRRLESHFRAPDMLKLAISPLISEKMGKKFGVADHWRYYELFSEASSSSASAADLALFVGNAMEEPLCASPGDLLQVMRAALDYCSTHKRQLSSISLRVIEDNAGRNPMVR